ncbi:hypothetical protein CDAR_242181 [Caerostris darwini]|uniref:Uncharacterized protein n=1 Tax=Caerostris darwini TaxID=1538125 RepID=A0AAV4NPJ2_9ARAC|nr:hypothetical protein CDAR_242181 [Caerostris darwini]
MRKWGLFCRKKTVVDRLQEERSRSLGDYVIKTKIVFIYFLQGRRDENERSFSRTKKRYKLMDSSYKMENKFARRQTLYSKRKCKHSFSPITSHLQDFYMK